MIQPRLWPLTRVDPTGSIVDAVAGTLQRQQVFRELGFPNKETKATGIVTTSASYKAGYFRSRPVGGQMSSLGENRVGFCVTATLGTGNQNTNPRAGAFSSVPLDHGASLLP